ncbi:MAG: GFA family protein [Proteobacteria bacterium]|nr:GFA family protein [Pseudomonadota bacterium]
MSESRNIHSGSCLCGAVKYTITGDVIMAGHCHCVDCRKSSGTGHVTLAMFRADAYKIDGKLTEYSSLADSGSTVTRSFCPTCGSRLFGQNGGFPGMRAVNVGTLDDPGFVQPQFRVYTKHHLDWDTMDPAIPGFPEMPPREKG